MEFEQYKFNEIAKLFNGRAYLMPELLHEGKYKIVRVGNFSGKDEWFYSDMELDSEKYCYEGDLLYKWACNFGPEIWTEGKTIYHYHIWKVEPKKALVDKLFLFYYLKYITPFWLSGTNGTTMTHITKETMESKKILIPKNIKDQIKIATLLSELDQLIQQGNEAIAILENSIQLIYREWFVSLKFPGYKKHIFTNTKQKGWRLANKEMMIPKNWHFGELKEIGTFQRGKNITSVEMVPGNIPVISAGIKASGFHDQANVFGDSLTISSSGANAGFLLYHLDDIWAADCSFCQSPFIWFIYSSLNFLRPVLDNLQIGAAQPHVYPKDIDKLSILIPDKEIVGQFCDIVQPFFNQIKVISEKNKIRIAQRDMLLPRLMSGKLDVSGKEIV